MLRSPILAIALAAALAVAAPGCGDDEDDPSRGSQATTGGATEPGPGSEPPPGPGGEPGGDGGATGATGPDSATDDPPSPDDPIEDRPGGPLAQSALDTTSAYFEALNDRDGAALCELIDAEALARVEMPVAGGSCAEAVSASLGYQNPRGVNVWRRTTIIRPPVIQASGPVARAVVGVRHDFAQGRRPSLEDDIIYLLRSGGGWIVAKPSTSFFRAIGRANIPPSVLAPPR